MGVLYEVFGVEIESLQIRLHWSSAIIFCMGFLYEVFVVEIESLQIRLLEFQHRRKMEALPPAS